SLAAIDVLDFAGQVLMHRFLARDPQDVVRHERTVDESLAGPHPVARVHAKVLAVGNEVLAFDAGFAADDNRALAALLLAQDFHRAIDLGDNGRVAWLTGLEDFRHPRQTTGDVLSTGSFTRSL